MLTRAALSSPSQPQNVPRPRNRKSSKLNHQPITAPKRAAKQTSTNSHPQHPHLYFLPNLPSDADDDEQTTTKTSNNGPSKRRRRRRNNTTGTNHPESYRSSLSPEDTELMSTISKARRLSDSDCDYSMFTISNKRRRTSNETILSSPKSSYVYKNNILSKSKSYNNLPTQQQVIHARNQITVKWLWLVSAIAKKLYYSYTQSFPEMQSALSLSDLIQEGVVGLMLAIEKYDLSKGYPFDSFAFYTIKHTVIRAVQNQSRPIRLPIHVLEKLSKMRKVSEYLRANNKPINADTIAQYAGISKSSVELYLQRSHSTVSIDQPISSSSSGSSSLFSSSGKQSQQRKSSTSSKSNNGGMNGGANQSSGGKSSLSDFLIDHSIDVARYVDRTCTKEAVKQLVNTSDLKELERNVLFLKFGLDDGVERVRAEVSRILDVRVHNVRRAELSALKKLRESIGDDTSWVELVSENY